MNLEKTEQQLLWDELNYFDDIPQPDLSTTLQDVERGMIHDALVLNNNNRTKAAQYLGIGRTLLIHKIKKYNLV